MFKNIIGLIVEYNPFHNGHLHHIQEIDRLFEDNIKIAVMSGDFVQRGEPSLINRFENTVIVSNELGMGIVPSYPLGRYFREIAGKMNQKIAEIADEVYFVVSGIPMKIK